MKNSAYIALAVGLLLATLIIVIAQGSNQILENTNQAGKYTTLIDETIAKCRNKAALFNSKSPNIRRQAVRACLKGAYLKLHKKEIDTYLVTIHAEPIRNRIEYYLNKRFYEALKPDELSVLLEASQMLNRSE